MSIGIKGSKEFYEELQEGDGTVVTNIEFFANLKDKEEYQIVMMRRDSNHQIANHINGNHTVIVKEKNNYYEEDDNYKIMYDAKKKSKDSLDKYEFYLNHKNK